ncbi:MAG: methylenetetrahydrofolate reductase [Rhodospirillales bacterium]|nr:MAG: methylenetetrahydrofolate reductase [Rhodospirillales bacterium]
MPDVAAAKAAAAGVPDRPDTKEGYGIMSHAFDRNMQILTPAQQRIIDFLDGFSIETTPGTAAKTDSYRALLAVGTTVNVTFLTGSDFADTIKLVQRLKAEGMRPVPHIAARSVPSRAQLDSWLDALVDTAGIDEVLLIGGAAERPLGPFDRVVQMLETGLFEKHGIRRIGVAGHPEGSPDFSDAAAMLALADKNAYARDTGCEMHIITQFVFEAPPVIAWERRIREAGNRLPIHIGVPGLATIKTLLGHARACGIGPSMRVLTRQAKNLTKLMSVRAPDRLVSDLAACRAADPACGISKVHLYPLGGLRRTAAWVYAVLDGCFHVAEAGGFQLDVPID